MEAGNTKHENIINEILKIQDNIHSKTTLMCTLKNKLNILQEKLDDDITTNQDH